MTIIFDILLGLQQAANIYKKALESTKPSFEFIVPFTLFVCCKCWLYKGQNCKFY